MCANAFCPCKHYTCPNIMMAFQVTTSQGGTSCWTFSKHPQFGQTFHIHVNQAIPHKDIRLTTTLNDLFMNMPTIFQVTVLPVSSYVWNPGTFHLPTAKNPRESNKTHTNKSYYGSIDTYELWQDWSSVTLFDLWSLEGHGYVANKKLDNIMTKCFSSSTEMGWAKY